MDNIALPLQDNNSPKILVIEDEDSIRELVVTLLIAEDYEVIEAENGNLGIAMAIATPPDLIICDITLPGLDGYGVLQILQEDSTTETIPFIFLTARGTKENIRQGMNLGADDYLTKPFTTQELLDSIQARLRKHRSWREHFQQKQTTNSQQINYTVTHDPITQLPNQLALRDDLNQLLKRWQTEEDHSNFDINQRWVIPVFYLSIDRFERINELFGYQFGNIVLKHVVRSLMSSIAESAYLACLNYTDFVLIYPPDSKNVVEKLTTIVENILKKFVHPLSVESQKVLVHWNIGIITMPYQEYNFDQYLNQAKNAMEIARKRGNQNYYFYEQNQDHPLNQKKRLLDADLYEALHRHQFSLHYQPKVSVKTGKILGAEALLRWHHPTLGMISPGIFIPLAEKSSLISGIGQWVFEAVCHQIQIWNEQGFEHLRIAVNLSGRQFYQVNLADNLSEIIERYNVSAKQVELEVTESILISDVDLAIANLRTLKDRGFPIAIDDFGTGYSSLSYLQNFPFDILKIDRCFIHNIMRNVTNATIVKHVILMSEQLNLTTVAEGVENVAEFEFLRAQNCNEIQGYLFSKPVTAVAFGEMLQSDPNFLAEIKRYTQ
ncbi:MAG: EAL domain-containing protein [Limnothrix sp. RL_2_0]|nr:EAL domain-containing protein [Limnothrix sp. RL_2_0]